MTTVKSILLMPGLQAPRSAPAACRKKAKEQLRRFRRGERNYKVLHVRGKCAPGRGWLKIDIGISWRLLSRNSGADWELLTHERYNNALWK